MRPDILGVMDKGQLLPVLQGTKAAQGPSWRINLIGKVLFWIIAYSPRKWDHGSLHDDHFFRQNAKLIG
jgi:hypothetical protein